MQHETFFCQKVIQSKKGIVRHPVSYKALLAVRYITRRALSAHWSKLPNFVQKYKDIFDREKFLGILRIQKIEWICRLEIFA